MGLYMWSPLGWKPDDGFPLYRTVGIDGDARQIIYQLPGKEAWDILSKTSALNFTMFSPDEKRYFAIMGRYISTAFDLK